MGKRVMLYFLQKPPLAAPKIRGKRRKGVEVSANVNLARWETQKSGNLACYEEQTALVAVWKMDGVQIRGFLQASNRL